RQASSTIVPSTTLFRSYTGNHRIKNDTAFSGLPSVAKFRRQEFTEFLGTVTDIIAEGSRQQALAREVVCLLLKVMMLKYIRASGDRKSTRLNSSHVKIS